MNKRQIAYKVTEEREAQIKQLCKDFQCNRTELLDLSLDFVSSVHPALKRVFEMGTGSVGLELEQQRISANKAEISAKIFTELVKFAEKTDGMVVKIE